MKYLLILLLGICMGIGGELLIPESLYTTIGSGCFKEKDSEYTYLPELRIYTPNVSEEFRYPIEYGGRPMSFVPSYRYAYALLTGEITYLNQQDCNALIEKILQHERKK